MKIIQKTKIAKSNIKNLPSDFIYVKMSIFGKTV